MSASLVLVINSGSSSLKFSLFDMERQVSLLSGMAEQLETEHAQLSWETERTESHNRSLSGADREKVLRDVLALIEDSGHHMTSLMAVGHRVVHGGEAFSESVLITPQVTREIEAVSHLAPLHNPGNLAGIEAINQLAPDIPQVAVFDTAFHQSMPPSAWAYAIPRSLYRDHGIRRYGFHGTSHRFVAAEAVRRLELPEEDHRLVTAHLGNGCSATAVLNGRSMDTTMGLTPLEGLVMGTRSGDVDPSLHQYLHDHTGQSLAEITDMLNRQSGLLGLSELSGDMRHLTEAMAEGHEGARLAVDVFCYRLARQIAGLVTATGGLDALVFTGGIGENAAVVREKVVGQLHWLGLNLDVTANLNHGREQMGRISTTWHPAVIVIPTEEEWMIARDAWSLTQR